MPWSAGEAVRTAAECCSSDGSCSTDVWKTTHTHKIERNTRCHESTSEKFVRRKYAGVGKFMGGYVTTKIELLFVMQDPYYGNAPSNNNMTFFVVGDGSSQSSSLSTIHQIKFWWIWMWIQPIDWCGSGSRADSAARRRTSKRCDAATRELDILVLWQDSPDHDPVDLDLDPTNQTHRPRSRAIKSDQSN